MQDLTPSSTPSRVYSIDILRGIIMVIMALDHVRDYFGQTPFGTLDLTQTSPLLFFTRWITHLCAPNFIFLSGVSIFLYEQKVKSKKQVTTFLLTRGLWLIAVEVIVISYLIAWDRSVILLLVFWVIGVSMVLLAFLVWLPKKVLLVFSLVMIVFHQLIPDVGQATVSDILLSALHNRPFFVPTTPPLVVAYSIIPWVGVMMLGYCIGHWVLEAPGEQKRKFMIAGSFSIILFFIIRWINIYGDPAPWSTQERGEIFTMLSFFNVSKSPPSLLFLLITLGIGFVLLSALTTNRGLSFFRVYGSVPFFYFVVHFVVIACATLAWTSIQFGRPVNIGFASPETFPSEYSPNLLRVYLVWTALVLSLYYPCRWFGQYRKCHPENKWLSYL